MEMGFKGKSSNTAVNLEDCKNRILSVIYALVNKTASNVGAILSPVQVLRTHKVLQEHSALMLSEFETWDLGTIQEERKVFLVDMSVCYAVFQYWSLGINAAKSVLNSFLSAVCLQRNEDEVVLPDHPMKFCGSKHHEELLAFHCKISAFHLRNNICPVKPLREQLLTSLSAFPENAFFLHSYVMLELRSCTSYSIRRYFDSILDRSRTPVPWLFAILYETQRQKTYQSLSVNTLVRTVNQEHAKSSGQVTEMPQTGVVHRLRSLYERAIRHPSARHCVAIWRSYMKFEVETGDPRQAKAIFYQSLQSCAWAKIIYLDAIKLFPELWQDVHDMMEDKELRIRAPLEEFELLMEA